MANLGFNYLGLPEKYIEDKNDFFKSGIKEASKIRNLLNAIYRLFLSNTKNTDLFLIGDKDIYRFDIYNTNTGRNKHLISRIYYIPGQFRLDLYDGYDISNPMLVWKSKKLEYANIPVSLKTVKADTIFASLISIL